MHVHASTFRSGGAVRPAALRAYKRRIQCERLDACAGVRHNPPLATTVAAAPPRARAGRTTSSTHNTKPGCASVFPLPPPPLVTMSTGRASSMRAAVAALSACIGLAGAALPTPPVFPLNWVATEAAVQLDASGQVVMTVRF
ncbi:MAG: hypothetical protein EOO41_03660, partial [Methanobacteriota archaeon]